MGWNLQMTDGGGNWRGAKKGGTTYNTVTKKSQGPNMMDTETPANNSKWPSKPGGSTGGSTGGGSVSSGPVTGTAPQTDGLTALLAAYEDTYGRAINAYNNAYNTAVGNIGAAFNTAANSAYGNLSSTRGLINDSYNRSHGEVTRDAERALREAYINHMMSRRDLEQSLSAQGLNGGASETTLASLTNRYGNSRTGIEENRNTNITNLAALRDENLAKALQAYNSEIANLEMNRANQINNAEMARASQIAAAEQARAQLTAQIAMQNVDNLTKAGYLTTGILNGFAGVQPYNAQPMSISAGYNTGLQSLSAAMNGYSYDPSEVTNVVNPISTQQAVNMSGSDYAKYLAQLEMMAGAQRNPALGAGLGTANAQTLAQMLAQLGAA